MTPEDIQQAVYDVLNNHNPVIPDRFAPVIHGALTREGAFTGGTVASRPIRYRVQGGNRTTQLEWKPGSIVPDIGQIEVDLTDSIVVDTTISDKTLVKPVETQRSLLNLRDELVARMPDEPGLREALFKINSCLYSEYPHH